MGRLFDRLEEVILDELGSRHHHGDDNDEPRNPNDLLPIHRKLHELEIRMTSAETGQQALTRWAEEITQDVQEVASELASVIQQNQSGQLTADQVNAALSPIHERLSGLVNANPVDPGTTTDPTNSPGPDSPVVVPAPDAPTDEPTADPTVNPVDVNPASQPDDTANGVTDPTVTPTSDNSSSSDSTNTNDFRDDL